MQNPAADLNMEYLKFLRHPMYRLYYIESLSGFDRMDAHELEVWKTSYSEDLIAAIVRAIGWALDNPEFDLSDVLPDLRHSNADIRSYLAIVLRSLRDAGLA